MQHIVVHLTLYLKNFRRCGPGEFLIGVIRTERGCTFCFAVPVAKEEVQQVDAGCDLCKHAFKHVWCFHVCKWWHAPWVLCTMVTKPKVVLHNVFILKLMRPNECSGFSRLEVCVVSCVCKGCLVYSSKGEVEVSLTSVFQINTQLSFEYSRWRCFPTHSIWFPMIPLHYRILKADTFPCSCFSSHTGLKPNLKSRIQVLLPLHAELCPSLHESFIICAVQSTVVLAQHCKGRLSSWITTAQSSLLRKLLSAWEVFMLDTPPAPLLLPFLLLRLVIYSTSKP